QETEIGIPHPAKLLGKVVCLFFSHGDKSPVPLPGAVVDLKEEVYVLTEATEIDRPDNDRVLLLEPLHPAYQAFRWGRTIKQVRQQVFSFDISGRLDEPRNVWQVVGHHHRRRVLEAIYQEPALFVGGKAHRATNLVHPPLSHPLFSSG